MFKQICLAALALFPAASFACNEFYVGTFGGGGYSNYHGLSQRGAVFFTEAQGGLLPVNASGNANNKSSWIAGLHAGREWEGWGFCTGNLTWWLSPAGEVEGYYLNSRINARLTNITSRLPEHLFVDNFKMNTGVLLVNSIWTIKNPYSFIQPYVGIGIGAALVSLYGANSTQVSPSEFGINHFNSGTSDFNWSFAIQAKAGAHVNITRNWRFFADYRYLYLRQTTYQFGSTQYPNHAATSKWRVLLDSMGYSLGSVGIEYSFDAIC